MRYFLIRRTPPREHQGFLISRRALFHWLGSEQAVVAGARSLTRAYTFSPEKPQLDSPAAPCLIMQGTRFPPFSKQNLAMLAGILN